MITTVAKPRVHVVILGCTCSIIILWLHSLSGVIRSLLCNPRASSPAIINIRISVPYMRDTTRARARKYGKDAGLSPSSTHVRQ